MARYTIGRILPIFQGNWDSTQSYNRLDIVLKDTISYVSKIDNNTTTPSESSANWQVVCRGATVEEVEEALEGGQLQIGRLDVEYDITASSIKVDGYDVVTSNTLDLTKEQIGVNLIDFSDFLHGYSVSQGQWIVKDGSIATNAIEGVQGDTFTSQGIKGFNSYPNNVYVCEFDENNNYLTRQMVNMRDTTNQIATFTLSNANTSYFRLIIRYGWSNDNLGVGGLTNIQVEKGSTATEIDTEGVKYKYILPQSSVENLETDLSDLSTLVANNTASIDTNTTDIENIKDSLIEEELVFETIATGSDVYTDRWYDLSVAKATTYTNVSSINFRGYLVPAVKGDVFILSTYGGAGGARSYAITSSDRTILERAGTSTEDRNLISNPKTITITQDNAAYLYMNCDSSSSRLAQFYLKKKTDVIYHDKIEQLQDSVDTLEEEVNELIANSTTNLKANAILLIGASFAYNQNTWFEQSCEKLGLTAINKAVSGSRIHNDAVRMMNGTLFTDINSFDILAIMHVHNYNVNSVPDNYKDFTAAEYEADTDFVTAMQNNTNGNNWYSCAFDYVIKKYETLCYAEKDNSASPWYNTQYGKPCIIILCTSWHDARQTYNNAIKELSVKWGTYLCNFADNIGFSCQKNNYATGAQPSIIYANETENISFSMDGVTATRTVGWHPLRGTTQYIQQRMARIFTDCVNSSVW